MDPVSAILAFERAGEIDWSAPDCLGWFLYDFADATIFPVPELRAKSLTRELRDNALPGVVYAKVALRYVDVLRDVTMSRKFAEAVWKRYKADDTDLRDISSLAEQHAFVCSLGTEPESNVSEGMNGEEDNSGYV